MPAKPGTADLVVRTEDGTSRSIHLPLVKRIDMSMTASLTEMGTIMYGFRNNFCMDLGTVEKLTVTFDRVNPFPYNDGSDYPEDWSNGKWYLYLESLFDFWQNFGYDSGGLQAGGFTFKYNPSDEDLYPAFTKNVFLTGSINCTMTVQKMTVELPFTVARMTGTGSNAPTVTVTLVSNDPYFPSIEQTYLANFTYNVPGMPASWGGSGEVLVGWRTEDGVELDLDSTISWGEDATLTAIWRQPIHVEVWYPGQTKEYEIPVNATRITYYLVGGGGGAGGAYYESLTTPRYSAGGGGAGAETVYGDIGINTVRVITCTAGERGTSSDYVGIAPSDGTRGEDSIIYVDGVELDRAGGGDPGRRAANGATGEGGEQYFAGGSRTGNRDGTAGDGGIAGAGGDGDTAGGTHAANYSPSCGGGASNCNYVFRASDGTGVTFQSIGGNGSTSNNDVGPVRGEAGQCGGGGGSGCGGGGDGGEGIAVVVVY